MSIAIQPEVVSPEQSIRSAVAQLGAEFRRMQTLGAELASLDSVNHDICHTHAMIRRDVANTVLQTAFSVKTYRVTVPDQSEVKTSSDVVDTVSESPVPDQWAKRLLRWADRLGRDLFGLPSAQAPTVKENRTLLPPQNR